MRSATQDVSKSLQVLADSFSQLSYLASLRDETGNYRHWGLEREYGEGKTGEAFRQAHRRIFETILQADFSDLLDSLRRSCQRDGRNYEAEIRELFQAVGMEPDSTPAHSAQHFKYLLASLLALSQASY